MSFLYGQIDGVIVRELGVRRDHRGWLAELFRADELPEQCRPEMAYMSETLPGASRGPHEHANQTDCFAFFGPGDFTLYLWDNRPASPTQGRRMKLSVGAANPTFVLVPPGVVHAYKNAGTTPAWTLNAPNRLYAGRGRKEPVDEIRHENLSDCPFVLD